MNGPEYGYLDLLEKRTVEKIQQDSQESKKKCPLRPSSAGACTRTLAFQMTEYLGKAQYKSKPFEPSVHRLLNLGTSIEWHVLSQLQLIKPEFEVRYKQQALSFGRMQSISDPTLSADIEGSIDLVLWSEKHKAVVDIKSKKDWSVGKFKTNWNETTKKLKEMKSVKTISDHEFWVEDLSVFLQELKDPFFESNFMQLNFYANSEFIKSHGIDHGLIIQYNKNTSEMRGVRFKPSIELFQKSLSKFQVALDAGGLGDPSAAPRDYEKGSIACRYCKYESPCKKLSKNIIEEKTKEEPNGL